ncbi:MAG: hypothetical protein H6508_09535 [Calditrichaeota bacterium]|nr:hypothetical protein [Calditrichota bacterium]
MEGWQKVLMAGNGLDQHLQSPHAFDCIYCHGGQDGVLGKDEAHSGMVADPSWGENNVCARCHDGIAHNFATSSLHATMKGYHTLFEARTGRTIYATEMAGEKFEAQCNKCHATCGECHISRPKSVGGGFMNGHFIKRTPDMGNQCTACHGSRVGDEFQGRNEGYRADVHYVPNAMQCTACHDADEMHGDGTAYPYRYAVQNGVKCEDCHNIQIESNVYHDTHGSNFACQVCHSQDYKNCTTCHAGDGIQQPSWMQFKIGRNPLYNDRPKEYVVLRHIPVAEETFASWGVSTPNYSSLPTFKYATPHNILRWTDRTQVPDGESCFYACHSTANSPEGWFLRQVDLDNLTSQNERAANQHLILPDGPPPWE